MSTSSQPSLSQRPRRRLLPTRRARNPLESQPFPELAEKADGHLRLITLNLAHGRSTRSHQALLARPTVTRNLQAIARTVRELSADIAAFQEADGPSAWSGNFDHVSTLAELTELSAYYRGEHNPFGLGRFQLSSGTALMSRLPLHNLASHRFGLSWRDTKGFVLATTRVPSWGDAEIDVASVHLDFLRPSIRRRQIRQLAEVVAERERPLVLLGDLNHCFKSEPRSMHLLIRELGLQAYAPTAPLHTWPSTQPRRRLDWILISPELTFTRYETVPLPLSDHLAVVADVAVG